MMQMYFSRSSSTAFLLNKPLIHKRTLRNLHKIFLRKIKNHVIYLVRSNIDNGFLGEVTEWLKVLAWNAGVVKATEGSNPSLTAIVRWVSWDTNILIDGRVPVTVDP